VVALINGKPNVDSRVSNPGGEKAIGRKFRSDSPGAKKLSEFLQHERLQHEKLLHKMLLLTLPTIRQQLNFLLLIDLLQICF
jgi:hypothetical protein